MRHKTILLMVAATMLLAALPAAASNTYLEGPDPAKWLSDPDGVDGENGIEQGDPVEGSSGWVKVNDSGATVRVKATGLEPGHTYTMWLAYFNDQTQCIGGCTGADRAAAGGGVLWGAGRVGTANGDVTFTAKLKAGDGAEYVGGSKPPPFSTAAYEPGPNNELHLVIRSHGPKIAGLVHEQLSSFNGGCEYQVGPTPGQLGDFPIPLAEGECGDVQLYVFK